MIAARGGGDAAAPLRHRPGRLAGLAGEGPNVVVAVPAGDHLRFGIMSEPDRLAHLRRGREGHAGGGGGRRAPRRWRRRRRRRRRRGFRERDHLAFREVDRSRLVSGRGAVRRSAVGVARGGERGERGKGRRQEKPRFLARTVFGEARRILNAPITARVRSDTPRLRFLFSRSIMIPALLAGGEERSIVISTRGRESSLVQALSRNRHPGRTRSVSAAPERGGR